MKINIPTFTIREGAPCDVAGLPFATDVTAQVQSVLYASGSSLQVLSAMMPRPVGQTKRGENMTELIQKLREAHATVHTRTLMDSAADALEAAYYEAQTDEILLTAAQESAGRLLAQRDAAFAEIGELEKQVPVCQSSKCWKCGDSDAAFQAKCSVPTCEMKAQPPKGTDVKND